MRVKTNDDAMIENFANQLIAYQENRNLNAAKQAAKKFIKTIDLRLTISILIRPVDTAPNNEESKTTSIHQELCSQAKPAAAHKPKPKKHPPKHVNNHHPRAHRPH